MTGGFVPAKARSVDVKVGRRVSPDDNNYEMPGEINIPVAIIKYSERALLVTR